MEDLFAVVVAVVVVVVVVVVVIVEHLVSKRLSGNASFDLHDSLIGPPFNVMKATREKQALGNSNVL